MNEVIFQVSPVVTNEQLNLLFTSAWGQHKATDFQQILKHSLLYICAIHQDQVIGFVNVAWDGGIHAFLVDTTVHQNFQRLGIGLKLVREAVSIARERGIEWLHVDYEPHLRMFYENCGFQHTEAGLINLKNYELD